MGSRKSFSVNMNKLS